MRSNHVFSVQQKKHYCELTILLLRTNHKPTAHCAVIKLLVSIKHQLNFFEKARHIRATVYINTYDNIFLQNGQKPLIVSTRKLHHRC